MKLSVSMIVKNEQEMIARCLKSIKDADEIVILDTGSTDKTKQVIEGLGYDNINYIENKYEWKDDFADARNESLKYVTGDWVLIIDADEYVEQETIPELKKYIKLAEEHKKRYITFNIISVGKSNKEGKQATNFFNVRAFKYTDDVKDEMYWKCKAHNYLMIFTPDHVINSPCKLYYDHSPAHNIDSKRTLRILEKAVAENPDDGRYLYYLGREYMLHRQYSKSVQFFVEAIKHGTFIAEKADACLRMATMYLAARDYDVAKHYALQALMLNPNYKDALYLVATLTPEPDASVWRKFADIADNNNVLFRSEDYKNIIYDEKKPKVYYARGMEFFGKRMTKYLGFDKYNIARDVKNPCFFQGLYWDKDYEVFKRHKGKRIVFWNGSDLLRLQHNKEWQLLLKYNNAEHLTQYDYHVDMLAKFGIKAKHAPIFFGDLNKYDICYRHTETPHIYLHCNKNREEEYGINFLKEFAPKTKDITFHVYGVEGKDTDKIKYHGWVDEEQFDKDILNYQGCLKLIQRDKVTQTVLKSILLGHHPIIYKSFKCDHILHAEDEAGLISLLDSLKSRKQPNLKAREHYLKQYNQYFGDFTDE